ncbi:FAD-dependent monooxygenase [Polyangium aurulentum]|uniref:FAD-dependent monooxygenase n=1 Tax=Polyangium aurulentum TaxID=2567896 RepID=UPI0010AE8ED1|nr:FAD-dependent monooxygenase [Polyangium aurulentum]UQA59919.1 FAD-dependent monooxygenase [Polyangium aurulentum]
MARSILVSGAGIAGPALACRLGRAGFSVTVVERSPALRRGGQAVDFRGPVHMRVLREMGLFEALAERRTHMGALQVVDARGRVVFTLPPSFASGELEIERGDLVDVLFQKSRDSAEYIFGDSIASIAQDGRGVDVTFERERPRRFDLVVGADGIHSRVRALAFGEERCYVRHHGYSVATFRVPNLLGLERRGLIYSEPGRAVCLSSTRSVEEAVVMLVFTDSNEPLRARFAGMGWEVPRLLPYLDGASDLYTDTISRVDVDGLSRGRVVLLGDAGYGATIGGQGTGVAVVAAYVLAGELAREADHARAFARYEAAIAGYARGCQATARHMGPFFAPRSRVAITLRNAMYRALTSRPLAGVFERMTAGAASDVTLPTYV